MTNQLVVNQEIIELHVTPEGRVTVVVDPPKPADVIIVSELPGPRGFPGLQGKSAYETAAEAAGPATILPIDHVTSFTQSEGVPGADVVLSDNNDSTYVVLDSSEDSNWFIFVDSAELAGAESFSVRLKFEVISRDMTEPGFGIRFKLSDTGVNYYFQGTYSPVSDGVNEIVATLNAESYAAHPPEWDFVDMGEGTFEGLRDGIAADPMPTLRVLGYDGIPYVVNLLEAQVIVGEIFPSEEDWLASLKGQDGEGSRWLVEEGGAYPDRPEPVDRPVVYVGTVDPTSLMIDGDAWINQGADVGVPHPGFEGVLVLEPTQTVADIPADTPVGTIIYRKA